MNINGDRLMWLHVYGTLAEIRRRGDRSSSKLLMTVYAVIHTGMLNFAKCWPILIILSLPYFQINCRDSWNKICHLTSNVLQHYLAKIGCWTLQLYGTSFNANVMQNHLFTVSAYTRNVEDCFIGLNRLIYNIAACAKLVCSQETRMLWVPHATGRWMRQWCVIKCCSAWC